MTPPEGLSDVDQVKRDEERLAELGYKQELSRTWSAFTNFAISFTIISVLAGCFTSFGFAWLNGGPIAVSLGWPLLCLLIFCVAFSMAELTSAYPTAGGPYWWAHDLGGKGWSWMTGWFNIVGLLGIVASVAYGAAIFLNILLGLYGLNILGINFGDTSHVLSEQFLLFLIILLAYTVVNIFADRFLAVLNNISVGWHLLGVAVVIGLLWIVPDHHQSADFVFTAEVQRVRLLRRLDQQLRVLVLRPADRVPADDVHGDGLRRLRSHRRGDPGRRDQRGAGRLALGVLLGHHRLGPAALVPVRGHERECDRRRRRVLDVHLHLGARSVGGEAGDPDRDRRPAVLRRRRSDQRVTDLVRVLARPGDPGLEPVPPGEQGPGAVQRGDRGLVLLAGDLDPGAVREERRPVRVLRADRNLHGRPVRRLHHPGVPAAPGRRLVQARPVDARREVQVGQHHRDPLRDPGRVRPRPAVHTGGPAVERRVRREPRELHAAGGRSYR